LDSEILATVRKTDKNTAGKVLNSLPEWGSGNLKKKPEQHEMFTEP